MREEFFRIMVRDIIIFSMLAVFIGIYGPITFQLMLSIVFGWFVGAFFFEYILRNLSS